MPGRVSKLYPMFTRMAVARGRCEADEPMSSEPAYAGQSVRHIYHRLAADCRDGGHDRCHEDHQHSAIIEQTWLRAQSTGTSLAALCGGYLPSYSDITLAQADMENGIKALQ